MDKIGEIEIRVIGKSGHKNLSPDNYDIKQIAAILQNVEDLLYPNNKKDRPIITYDIEEGSVKHKFKTTIQAVIGFSAILSQVQANNSIDFLELKTARAIENIQNLSRQKNYEFQIKTSLKNEYELTINPSTRFIQTEETWVEAELYFYGILRDAGGKSKANIHLDTQDYGYLAIETGQEFLKEREENLLYRRFGVRAVGLQNLETGEVDTKSLKLLELIDYSPKFDESYLNSLIEKAKSSWKKINPDEWLIDLRGGYEAQCYTSFFIRLLNDEDKLHNNALGYYKYFLENEITLKVSTITIAEYCVLGKITDLPLTNIQILPFNLKEAQRAGEFANILFTENKVSITSLHPRAIIPNDSKLFAQADIDKTIIYFVTSDVRSKSTLKMLKNGLIPKFEIISIDVPFSDTFGILDL